MRLTFKLSSDGNSIEQLTDIGLVQDEALYDYGMELTDEECRQVLRYIVEHYKTTDNVPAAMETILSTLFPEKYKAGQYGNQ